MTPRAGRPSGADRGPDGRLLGLGLFLAALTMFFGAGVVGHLVIRAANRPWPPEGAAVPVTALWISTGLLALSTVSMEAARRAAHRRRDLTLRAALLATTGLAGLFLVAQASAWFDMVEAGAAADSSLWALEVFTLTGLHGAHVVGGLVPLAWCTVRATRGDYAAQGADITGVRMCTWYWHFLGAAWVVIFGVLLLDA